MKFDELILDNEAKDLLRLNYLTGMFVAHWARVFHALGLDDLAHEKDLTPCHDS